MKIAGTGPTRRVNAPWTSPRKNSSSTSGAPTTASMITTTHPVVPAGVVVEVVGAVVVVVVVIPALHVGGVVMVLAEPPRCQHDNEKEKGGECPSGDPSDEARPKVSAPGPRQAVVPPQAFRTVDAGRKDDGAEEAHPQG